MDIPIRADNFLKVRWEKDAIDWAFMQMVCEVGRSRFADAGHRSLSLIGYTPDLDCVIFAVWQKRAFACVQQMNSFHCTLVALERFQF